MSTIDLGMTVKGIKGRNLHDHVAAFFDLLNQGETFTLFNEWFERVRLALQEGTITDS